MWRFNKDSFELDPQLPVETRIGGSLKFIENFGEDLMLRTEYMINGIRSPIWLIGLVDWSWIGEIGANELEVKIWKGNYHFFF